MDPLTLTPVRRRGAAATSTTKSPWWGALSPIHPADTNSVVKSDPICDPAHDEPLTPDAPRFLHPLTVHSSVGSHSSGVQHFRMNTANRGSASSTLPGYSTLGSHIKSLTPSSSVLRDGSLFTPLSATMSAPVDNTAGSGLMKALDETMSMNQNRTPPNPSSPQLPRLTPEINSLRASMPTSQLFQNMQSNTVANTATSTSVAHIHDEEHSTSATTLLFSPKPTETQSEHDDDLLSRAAARSRSGRNIRPSSRYFGDNPHAASGMMGLDTTASSPPQRSVFEPVHSPQLNGILLGNNFHPFMLGTPGRVDDADAEKRKGHPPLPTAPAAARKDDDMGRARSRRAPSHRLADFVDTNHPSVSAALDEDPQQLVRRAASASVPDKSSSTPAAQPPTGAQTASEDKHRGCNCKKSQCLKLYCECFARGSYCTAECNCTGCHNCLQHADARAEAIQQTLARDAQAFQPKVKNTDAEGADAPAAQALSTAQAADNVHHKGCHCKRSGCVKKYCECFQANVQCSDACKCSGCLNCAPQQNKPAEPPAAAKSDSKPVKQKAVSTVAPAAPTATIAAPTTGNNITLPMALALLFSSNKSGSGAITPNVPAGTLTPNVAPNAQLSPPKTTDKRLPTSFGVPSPFLSSTALEPASLLMPSLSPGQTANKLTLPPTTASVTSNRVRSLLLQQPSPAQKSWESPLRLSHPSPHHEALTSSSLFNTTLFGEHSISTVSPLKARNSGAITTSFALTGSAKRPAASAASAHSSANKRTRPSV